jgi:hypothetical protein
MKITTSILHSCRFVSALCLIHAAGVASAAVNEFLPPPDYDPNFGYPWSNPSHWSEGVPGPDDWVQILTFYDINSEPYPFFGPLLDVNATIDALTLSDSTSINNAVTGPGKNLFVTGSTDMGDASSLVNFAGRFSLGFLDKYEPIDRTLNFGPYFYLGDRESSGTGILEFKGADILRNKAVFIIYGANCFVRDQNTGLNAFRNLAVNDGLLSFNDGYQLSTTGNLTNNGTILLNQNPLDTRTPVLNVGGNLVNNGFIKLYSRSVFTVAGGLSGGGQIEILGLPVTCDVVGTWTQNGGVVNLGGSGIDGFTLKAIAFVAQNNTTLSGSGTLEAAVTITSGTIAPGNSTGTIAVKGDLALGAGSKLQVEIAGTTHDQVTQNTGTGGVTLGGLLEISTIDDFDDQVQYSSTWEILASSLPLNGAFANVASGARLNTADGKGSFQVDYGPGSAAPNKVVLSNYIAVNAPQTYAQWIATQDVAPEDGENDDPNGDGIGNLEAYFRGIAASGTTKPGGLNAGLSEGNLVITIRSPRTVTGIDLTSKVGTSLDSWTNGPLPAPAETTPTRNIYRISIPATDPRKFARFVITQTPPPVEQ